MDSLLSPQRIAALSRLAVPPATIEVVAQTASTNTDLLQRVASLPGPALLVAIEQTGGRGRAGRIWHSVPGSSLTFSLAWPFRRTLQDLSGLSLAVGVALVRALRCFGVGTELKWPNDVLINGRKLAGVLIETAQSGGQVWAVIGIGVNLTLPDGLEAQIGQPAADAPWLAQLDRHALLAGVLDQLSGVLMQFETEGFSPFVDEWCAAHAFAGQSVAVLDGEQLRHQGVAVGVDGNGRLLLETAGAGRIAVAAGDVSLRQYTKG